MAMTTCVGMGSAALRLEKMTVNLGRMAVRRKMVTQMDMMNMKPGH